MDDKNYCLEQLEVWIEAAIESEASAEEIYNCIRSTLTTKIAYYTIYLKHSKELLSLLSGNVPRQPTKLKLIRPDKTK